MLVSETDICDDDYTIQGNPNGPDSCYQYTRLICESHDSREIALAIKEDMEIQRLWPSIWFCNERGTIDECVIREIHGVFDYHFVS